MMSLFSKRVFSRKTRSDTRARSTIPLTGATGGKSKSEKKELGSAGSSSDESAGEHPLSVSSGCCSLEGRKSEDRIVNGVAVFKDIQMYAVIDGHGGNETADYLKDALPRVVTILCRDQQAKESTPLTLETHAEVFQELLRTAYKVCAEEWDGGVKTFSRKHAGAVATTVLVDQRTCIIAHVGDCRVVAATAAAAAELTEEHRASSPTEKQRIESMGGRVVAGRVKGLLSPSRVFGDIHIREDQNGTLSNFVAPEPDVSMFRVDLEGFMVISSDGVNDVFTAAETAEIVREAMKAYEDPAFAAKQLAMSAAARNNDDISVIVLNWGH